MIRFADIGIVTKNEVYLKRAIKEMEETLTTFKMKISKKKTQIQIFFKYVFEYSTVWL